MASGIAGFEMSPQQRRIFRLQQASGGLPRLGELALLLHHRVGADRLWRILDEVVERYDILRTTFVDAPGLRGPIQVIEPAGRGVAGNQQPAGQGPGRFDTAALDALFDELADRPFDLARGPLPRAAVLQLEDGETLLALLVPALLCDVRGLGILAQEVARRCSTAAGAPSNDEEPVQYVEYSDVANEILRSPEEYSAQGRLYWRNQESGSIASPQLSGVAAIGDPATATTSRVAHRGLRLDAPLAAGVRGLAARCGADAGTVALACWQILLGRLTGQPEMAVGVAFDGRRFEGLESTPGAFERYLPVPVALPPQGSFGELVTALAGVLREHAQWQDLFSWEAEAERGADSSSKACFEYDDANEHDLDRLGATILRRSCEMEAFLLKLACGGTAGDGFSLEVRFDPRGVDPQAALRMAERLQELLRSAVAQGPAGRLGALRAMPASEIDQVLRLFNDTALDLGSCRTLDRLFARRASLQPLAPSLVSGDRQWTYGELERAAARLAARLQRHGIGPEVRVALCLQRSPEMVIGLLAVLAAGGAYVPIDPALPAERIEWTLADSAAAAVLTLERDRGRFDGFAGHVLAIDGGDDALPPAPEPTLAVRAQAGNLAYVIFTSGSTGRPKGVMITHGAIANRVLWMNRTFPLREDDRVLQKTSASFDASVWEIFAPLIAGACLVLARPGGEMDSSYLVSAVQEHGVTILQLVPSMLAVVLQEPGFAKCASLRRMFCGGEALSLDLQRRFFAVQQAELVNLYGPTEVAIDATFTVCRRDQQQGPVPIGKPIANDRVYLLDAEMRPVLLGAAGEVYVGGAGLARGYAGRPDLTAERFLPSPFDDGPGDRLYRTGDIARHDPEGRIEYLGRADLQVKIRGYRIEPLEVESLLRQHPGVAAAAVLAREAPAGGRRLVAYTVAAAGAAAPTAGELRSFLAAKLPEYMMPAAFVQLPSLPRLPSGKLDPSAMPEPEAAASAAAAGQVVAPRTLTEELLHAIWVELLQRESCSVFDDFFELGGHSLLAMQVLMRVRATLAVELPLRSLFEATTIASLAAEVDSRRGAGTRPAPAIAKAARDRPLPLSFGQQRLWFLQRLEPRSTAYIIPMALRLSGALDRGLFAATLGEVVRRHEVLRTAYTARRGVPQQIVLPARTPPLPLIDLQALPEPLRRQAGRDLARREAALPFDLGADSPLRVTLLRCGPRDHLVLLTLHHIASDAWSMRLLVEEVSSAYTALHAGQAPRLPELPIQYGDYAAWQRTWLSGDTLDAELAFWRLALPGPHPLLELPADRPRSASPGTRAAACSLPLGPDLTHALHELSRRNGATDFMTALGGLAALLLRYSGQPDVRVGTPIAGRARLETERLIGFFVNTLVIRTVLDEDPTFTGTVAQVRSTMLETYLHQELPFEKLVEELQPERTLAQSPLFQVLFSMQQAPLAELRLPDLSIRGEEAPEVGAKLDLAFAIDQGDQGWTVTVTYRRELFDRPTMVRLLGQFATLLTGAAAFPERRLSELPVLAAAERHQLLREWVDTSVRYPRDASLVDLFAAAVQRAPAATALAWEDGSMPYGELDRRSDLLAGALVRHGVRAEQIVALHLERSPQLIVAVLAILKAGAAYLPLDGDAPAARQKFVLARAEVTLGITTSARVATLPQGETRWLLLDALETAGEPATQGPARRPSPESLAYVIFTSGSTGEPKGVAVSHRSVVRLVHGADYAHFGRDETFLLLASFSFDAATFELWGALLHGARLALMPLRPPSLTELAQTIARHRVTTLWLTAGLFQQLAEQGMGALAGLRQLLVGGDVLPVPQVRKALAELPRTRLINGYGPTEATTFTCCHTIADQRLEPSVPIGRPIANTRTWLLDRRLRAVPAGAVGEIHIAGDGLARGYVGRPDLTAEAFVPDPHGPWPGARMYRSGDLGRYRHDGTIEFLGRVDLQVKIRGFRVELAEIERALLQHPGVLEAVAMARPDAAGGNRLAAYYVPASPAAPTPRELRDALRERLPEYMMPADFVQVESFSLTANGKVDRTGLPAPRPAARASARLAPRDRLELQLVQIWEEVLDRSAVGIDDDFFELGGHSLLAVRLMAQIEHRFGRELPLTSLFAGGTVERQAELLRDAFDAVAFDPLVPIQPRGSRRPFFCVHPGGGGVLGYYGLAQHLGSDQPLYGLQAQGWEDAREPLTTVEAMAASYLRAIVRRQPHGPYLLGGWSFGGLVAFEMAQQLLAAGEGVGMVALLDASAELDASAHDDAELLALFLEEELPVSAAELRQLDGLERQLAHVVRQAQERGALPPGFSALRARRYFTVRKLNMLAASRYVPREYPGTVTLFRAAGRPAGDDPALGWRRLAAGGLEIEAVPGRHEDLLREPQVGVLAERLRHHLDLNAESPQAIPAKEAV